MPTQNIYDCKKIKVLADFACAFDGINQKDVNAIHLMKNKINEVVIEYNHIAKEFELYKKAFKQYVSEHP